MAGVYHLGTSQSYSSGLLPQTLPWPGGVAHAKTLGNASKIAAEKSVRLAHAAATRSDRMHAPDLSRRDFDEVVARADLSSATLVEAFKLAGQRLADEETADAVANAVAEAIPAPDRFGPKDWEIDADTHLALAMLDQLGEDGLAIGDGLLGSEQPDERLASTPPELEDESVPDNIPLPNARPKKSDKNQPPKANVERPAKAAAERPAKAVAERPAKAVVERPDRPVRTHLQDRDSDTPVLAFARPDKVGGRTGGAFRNLFSAPGKNSGVAVYDISSATVTMPDGQKLEAHSGIGEMADNPRYVHKKMRGPTPPDEYKLVMREQRFHGVEAIRLIPTDGKTKLGRTGLLAHTYLLRNRKAQSHGCIAFKDYQRFLTAFKKGKITRLIVVA